MPALSALLLFLKPVAAQNLPSLLLNKNINSTFSIIAYDSAASEWGIAVATNNIYVGNSTVYVQPGVGAFSVIAETQPAYAINGFKQLKAGKTIKQAVMYTQMHDDEPELRQVSGIDAHGNVYAFTGAALKYWKGASTHIMGKGFVVMGNQLADSVLVNMYSTFSTSAGSLAQRLLLALVAGQQAGGQITGKQSAALVVKGSHNEWFNQIDLRVDNSKTPFDDLQKLLQYHYGRIKINQAINAIKGGNIMRGKALLDTAQVMVEGWNGIYSKIAEAYLLLTEDEKAIAVIKKALAENAQWRENLPAFYCLAKNAGATGLFDENKFSVKDWNDAIQLMTGVNRTEEAIQLALKTIQKYPSYSYTFYLLGQAYCNKGNKQLAIRYLDKSLQLDPLNAEAKKLITQVKM